MFQCEKCGHRESSVWRASRFMLYTLTCKIDELELLHPILAEEIKQSGKRLEKGYYVYRYVEKSGRVYRSHKDFEMEYKRGHLTEKPKDPFQKKLT